MHFIVYIKKESKRKNLQYTAKWIDGREKDFKPLTSGIWATVQARDETTEGKEWRWKGKETEKPCFLHNFILVNVRWKSGQVYLENG